MPNQEYHEERIADWIPCEAEIKALPKRARIAFVARCARRVLPLYGAKWFSGMSLLQMRKLTTVVELVERAAWSEVMVSAKAAKEAANTAGAAEIAAIMEGPKQHASLLISVADCIEQTAKAVAGEEEHISLCPLQAYLACCFATTGADDRKLALPIRADFDALYLGAKEGQWTDATLVPADYCGAFWPNGLPAEWPSGAIAASAAFDIAVTGLWGGMKVLAKGHPIGQLGLLLDAVRRRTS